MRKYFLVLYSIFLIVFSLQSQTISNLSLGDCISLALKNSYLLQADNFSIKVANQNVFLQQGLAVPHISGELSSESHILKSYGFQQVWASINADWSLGNFLVEKGKAAMQDVETQQLMKEQNRLNIIGKVSSLYIAILQIYKQNEILDNRLIFLKKHYNLTVSMWKSGIRTQMDALQTKSEIVKLQQDKLRVKINSAVLKEEMAHILGFNSPDSLFLTTLSIEKTDMLKPPLPDTVSFNNNPLLQAYNNKIKAQNIRVKEVKAEQYPHIFLGGGYFLDPDPTGDGNYWRINAGMDIPIYYGNRIQHLTLINKIKTNLLLAKKMNLKRNLKIRLGKLSVKLLQLTKLMQLQHQQLSIAKKTLAFSEINYKAGLITNLDVLTAQHRYTVTQLSIEETRLDFLMNLIAFYVTSGNVDKIIALGNEYSKK